MTKREHEIVSRLARGEKLIRTDGMSYLWYDRHDQLMVRERFVTAALVRKMFDNGLLEVGCPKNEYRTRHIPTAFALAALADGE